MKRPNHCHRGRQPADPLPFGLTARDFDLGQCRQGNHRWEDVGNWRVNGRDMPPGARICVSCGRLEQRPESAERAADLAWEGRG